MILYTDFLKYEIKKNQSLTKVKINDLFLWFH